MREMLCTEAIPPLRADRAIQLTADEILVWLSELSRGYRDIFLERNHTRSWRMIVFSVFSVFT